MQFCRPLPVNHFPGTGPSLGTQAGTQEFAAEEGVCGLEVWGWLPSTNSLHVLSWGQAKIRKGPQPTGTEVSTRAPGWSKAKWLPWGRSQQRDKEQRGRHDGTCVLLATALQLLQGVPHTPPGTPAKAELCPSLLVPRHRRPQDIVLIWTTFRQPRASISLALVEMGLDSPTGFRPHPEAHCWGRSGV